MAKVRTQRNLAQVKEEFKTPEEERNKMETSNLPDAEFKTLVIRMLSELRGRVYKLNQNFNKEIVNIKTGIDRQKKKQPEKKNTLTEMKNTLLGINSAVDEAKDHRDLEYKEAENTQSKQKKELKK